MGLQVWLPFNKDNRNVGLANINVTENGITRFVSEGYTSGKCVKFGTEIGFYQINSNFAKHTTEMSVSFFVNFTSFLSENATVFGFFSKKDSAKWEDYIFGFLRNGEERYFCFCVSDTLSSTEYRCYTNKLSLDTWYHFVLTYKNGIMKIYQDGVLTSTYTTPIEPNFSSIDRLLIGNAPDIHYQTDIKMNDFRVYDHCITEEDVKRIYNCKIMDIVATRRGHGFFYDNSGLLINEFTSKSITYSRNSMYFDGRNSLIKAPSGLSINSGTLSIWYYLSPKPLINNDNSVIYLDGTSKMSIVLDNNGRQIITSCGSQYSGKYSLANAINGSWNNIVAVYSPKGGVSCFVMNGDTLQAKKEDSWPEYSEELFIGGSERYSASFNGYISKITVYRNQLTEDEAKQLYAIERIFLPPII